MNGGKAQQEYLLMQTFVYGQDVSRDRYSRWCLASHVKQFLNRKILDFGKHLI